MIDHLLQIRVLQIQSMFYKSNPVWFYNMPGKKTPYFWKTPTFLWLTWHTLIDVLLAN